MVRLERETKMAINRSEIEKFFEETREIRNLAIDGKNELFDDVEEREHTPVDPKYIGVYLSNYYSSSINKKFQKDLLK